MLYKAKCDIDWIGIYLKSYFYQNMNRTFADGKGFIAFFTGKKQNCVTWLETEIYRVSIKSFPDYQHLLQENYVE
jgi:hypothetical protein